MSQQPINYQPLEQMANVWNRATAECFQGGKKIFYAFAAVVVCILSFVIVGSDGAYSIFGIFVLYYITIWQKATHYQNSMWEDFANVNGWTIDHLATIENTTPPSIRHGHSRKLYPVISANIVGRPTKLFSYQYTTGQGKYSKEHFFTVAALQMPKSLPHILLETVGKGPDSKENIKDDVKLQLEGKFNEYFTLSMQRGQQIDVLSILTPDIMAALIDKHHGEDVEMYGNTLFIIAAGATRTHKEVKEVIDSVIDLSDELMENIRLSTPNIQ